MGKFADAKPEKVQRLADLGEQIAKHLTAGRVRPGLPPDEDRLEAIELMREYLEIHGYKIPKLAQLRRVKPT